MNYETARYILTEASDRIRAMMDKFDSDLKSGKATGEMLDNITKHRKDAHRLAGVESRNAAAATNPIRRRHHEMRAAHFKTHVRNYDKHHANAKKHHDRGDYWKAHAEGSSAANPRHMRDIPSHIDIHNH